MINCEQDLLVNLIELSPRNARRKFRQSIFESWEWKCAYCDKDLDYSGYSPAETDIIISREKYLDQLQGFWLGQSIGNWTGLITEMDKIEPPFYTDKNWGKRDQKNIWGSWN